MKSKLQMISTRDMTEEQWLQFRMNGIGGSEVGTVMMVNPYESRLELYHRKIGRIPLEKTGNEKMMWGHLQEDTIAKAWQYWDGTTEGLIKNIKTGKEAMFRKAAKVNAYIINPDYPWLFASIDRRILKNQLSFRYDAETQYAWEEVNPNEAILECKNMSGYALKMWETGVPPQYTYQFTDYMGICELDYAELAILKDGCMFDCIPFTFDPQMFEEIVQETRLFWKRILIGRELMAMYNLAYERNDTLLMQEYQAALDLNEPPFDPREGALIDEYRSKLHKAKNDALPIKGGLEDLEYARKYLLAHKTMTGAEAEKKIAAGYLKTVLKDDTVLDFGEQGRVTWHENARGVRSISVKVEL